MNIEYFSILFMQYSMVTKSADTFTSSSERAAQQTRPSRILDVAAALLVQWGYKRVTVDDIAQQAGVGTGTVYLHWKTKEALFESVLLRELHTLWDDLAQKIREDPQEALLHRLLSALLCAIKQRPLACALFTRDTLVLGKLVQRSLVEQNQTFVGGEDVLAMLRELGLMRSDVDSKTQAHAFGAVWTGFVFVDQLLPPQGRPPLDVQADALIHTIRHTFEPGTPPDESALRDQVAPRIVVLLEQARDHVARQLTDRIVV